MSFRTSFFGDVLLSSGPTRIPYGDNVLINTLDRGLTAQVEQAQALNQQFEATFMEGVERYQESQEESAQLIAQEIRWQANEIRAEISKSATNVTRAINSVGKYLGAELAEVRWAVERNTEVTRRILEVELNSHWNNSRQFYEEGVQCYERSERKLAWERFEKAVEACRTNAFAYEYLGFLSVHRDDRDQTRRNFDLALKFAPDDHHRAFANYHLARAFHASGDEAMSVGCARAAVGCDPKNTVYRYELVQALMRWGKVDGAIVELRQLILLDWKYWSVSASHRFLDPMRKQVNELLERMREEQRTFADQLMAELLGSLLRLDAVNDGSLTSLINSGRAKYSALTGIYANGKVFDYLEILKVGAGIAEQLVQEAISIYQGHIADSQSRLMSLVNSRAEEETNISNQILELQSQRESKLHAADLTVHELKQKYSEGNKEFLGLLLVGGCGMLIVFWINYLVASQMLISLGIFAPPPGRSIENYGEWGGYIFPMIVTSSISLACLFGFVKKILREVWRHPEFLSSIAKNRKDSQRESRKIADEIAALETRFQEREKANTATVRKLREESEMQCRAWQDKITAMQRRSRLSLM